MTYQTFSRWVLAVVAVLCLLVIGRPAEASAPVYRWFYQSISSGNNWDTPQAACSAKGLANGTTGWYLYVDRYSCTDGQGPFVSRGTACSDGTMPDGTKPTASQCPDEIKCPPAGTSQGNYNVTTAWATGPDPTSAIAKKVIQDGGWGSATWCAGICGIQPGGGPTSCSNAQQPSSHGYYAVTCTGPMVSTGVPCTQDQNNRPDAPGTEPTTPPPEKNRCPLGTKQIGTDSAGIPICRGDAPEPPPKKDTTKNVTNNADGSKTETTTETTTNSDGSTTTKTTTTTTWPDGRQTTTQNVTTGKTPDGKDGKNNSTDDAKNDLCKQHPELTICRNSQISGTCSAVSCDGDAIQCAMAREQAARNCEVREQEKAMKDDPATALAKLAINNQDPLANSWQGKNSTMNFALPTSLDSGGFLGGGASCFADKTFTVLGKAVTIPFSKTCDYLIGLRYALFIVALLASLRILGGAVFKE